MMMMIMVMMMIVCLRGNGDIGQPIGYLLSLKKFKNSYFIGLAGQGLALGD